MVKILKNYNILALIFLLLSDQCRAVEAEEAVYDSNIIKRFSARYPKTYLGLQLAKDLFIGIGGAPFIAIGCDRYNKKESILEDNLSPGWLIGLGTIFGLYGIKSAYKDWKEYKRKTRNDVLEDFHSHNDIEKRFSKVHLKSKRVRDLYNNIKRDFSGYSPEIYLSLHLVKNLFIGAVGILGIVSGFESWQDPINPNPEISDLDQLIIKRSLSTMAAALSIIMLLGSKKNADDHWEEYKKKRKNSPHLLKASLSLHAFKDLLIGGAGIAALSLGVTFYNFKDMDGIHEVLVGFGLIGLGWSIADIYNHWEEYKKESLKILPLHLLKASKKN